METNPYPLYLENLKFQYRSRSAPAIQDISFAVSPGEVLLIAGASGCGKTTLVRCINGLVPRSYKGTLEGKLLLNGEPITLWPLSKISKAVGTVLQDPERQILGTKVINEVAFGLENLGMPRPEIRDRVDEVLAYLGIAHFKNRDTFSLSGGEKQKVALAGVLAVKPQVLLLDEPLASLDPASAQEALILIRQLADQGMAVLIIEHRVEDVLTIHPDRVLFMMDGRIHYLGQVNGLEKAVNYHEVKLPARMILSLAAGEPKMAFVPPRVRSPQVDQSQPLIEFDRVKFGYETDQEVIKDVSLKIYPGDVIAVLGPNGAGKTTLVKHAIGLLKPKSGRVLIGGRDTREMSVAQIAGTLGYVFQSPSHMLFAPTVADELAFGPINLHHHPEEIQKEVKEAIEIVNLAGLENNPPLALSFGQQKRVSIAAILAMRSQILVMDEPTAGQDYKNYIGFMDSIIEINNFKAILFITHDIDLAVVYANRVLLVNQGMLVKDGKPEEVLDDLDMIRACRLIPTSLLKLNLELFPKTKRFMRAEALAQGLSTEELSS